EPGEQLGADDQDVLREPGLDVRLRRREAVDEAAAGRHHVERGRPRVADRLLDECRGRRHPVVGREGAEQDQVDVVGFDPGGPDRAQAGDRGHRCGRLVGGRDAPLPNPGPGPDPLVGRVDDLLEVGVRQDARRGVAAPARDVGAAGAAWARVVHSGSTSISGCFALTSAPLSGMTRTTLPARSDLISLNSFIASINPTTWPTATSRPAATNGAEPGAGEPYQTPVSGALTLGLLGASAAAAPSLAAPAAGVATAAGSATGAAATV